MVIQTRCPCWYCSSSRCGHPGSTKDWSYGYFFLNVAVAGFGTAITENLLFGMGWGESGRR